ncbi:MAG TPA: hypothetical protein VFA26_24720 [Gemmataceae bacterium]|nr:hypothetical protein [Gemmataceae bacterium]
MAAFYLVMAFLWLVVGAVLLANYYVLGGTVWTLPLGGTNISLGWFGLALAAYNLVRWWSFRVAWRQQTALTDAVRRREAQIAAKRREVREEADGPNPAFDFSSPPANPEQGERPS